jgi:hypothetical protein
VAALPYTHAIVQLDEGMRVPTNIVDMPVVSVFDDFSVEWTLVKFSRPNDHGVCHHPRRTRRVRR